MWKTKIVCVITSVDADDIDASTAVQSTTTSIQLLVRTRLVTS